MHVTGPKEDLSQVALDEIPDGDVNGSVIQATTLDDHPLIGARRWGVKNNADGSVTLWTEAYDIGRGRAIRSNLANESFTAEELAKHPQFSLWNDYLMNLAEAAEIANCIKGPPKLNDVEFNKFHGEHPWRDDLR